MININRFLTCIIVFFAMSACNTDYKIYKNGRFDHTYNGGFSYRNSTNDSCLVLDQGDKLPDSLTFINELKIEYGASADSLPINSVDYSLVEMAKEQAKLYGANIIQIESFTQYLCCKTDNLHVKLYRSKKPIESFISADDKKSCVLHIKNLDHTFGIKNSDSTCFENFCVSKSSSLYMKFNQTGVLFFYDRMDKRRVLRTFVTYKSFDDPGKEYEYRNSFKGYTLKTELGKEYFIHIHPFSKGGPSFQIVSKYDFYSIQ